MSITLPVAATCRLRGHVFTSDEPQFDDEGVSIGVVSIELDRCSRCGDPKRLRTNGYVPRHARVREDLTATDLEEPAETDDSLESVDTVASLDRDASAATDEPVVRDDGAPIVVHDDSAPTAVHDDIESGVREPVNAN